MHYDCHHLSIIYFVNGVYRNLSLQYYNLHVMNFTADSEN